jgi:hypothetical protein
VGWTALEEPAPTGNAVIMITEQELEQVRGWFTGRLPEQWRPVPPEVTVDRDEITVLLHLEDVEVEGTSEAELAEARAGRARAFREDTRGTRMTIAREGEQRFGRKVSWGVVVGQGDPAHRELFTHVAAPMMTRLRQPQRMVLDTLVGAGVARSRADALAWCVRLVGQHEGDWLADLREAMATVADVRSRGPAA